MPMCTCSTSSTWQWYMYVPGSCGRYTYRNTVPAGTDTEPVGSPSKNGITLRKPCQCRVCASNRSGRMASPRLVMSTTNSLVAVVLVTQNSGALCWACSFWAKRLRLVEFGDVAEPEDVGRSGWGQRPVPLSLAHGSGWNGGIAGGPADRSSRRCRPGTCAVGRTPAADGPARAENGSSNSHPGRRRRRRAPPRLRRTGTVGAGRGRLVRWVHSSCCLPRPCACVVFWWRVTGRVPPPKLSIRALPAVVFVVPANHTPIRPPGPKPVTLIGVPTWMPLRYTVTVPPLTRAPSVSPFDERGRERPDLA